MTPKIFLTGATGFIGGDILAELHSQHPDYTVTALVRSAEKGKPVTAAYPNVRIVVGSLDDAEILKREAAAADVVIHTADASDNEPAAKAIATGLLSGHTSQKPGYYIHTGGAGILTYFDSKDERYGEPTDKIFNDTDAVEELTTLPDEAFHRNVDKVVLEAGTKNKDVVKTAIICPGTIYGTGRGPAATRSRQAYELARVTLENKRAPVIGRGLSKWNNIHVHDLARLYVLLVDAATSSNNSTEVWGRRGYYLLSNGEHVWGELSQRMADYAFGKGYIKTKELEDMDKKKAMDAAGFEAMSWGFNSRVKAGRAVEQLGWKAKECSLEEEVGRIIEGEKDRLEEAEKKEKKQKK